MDIFQVLSQFAANGVAVMRLCHERSAYDIAGLGFSLSEVKTWKRTAKAFMGPADSPRVQRETVAAAERAGLSIARLTMINRYAARLTARGQAWKLRAELIAMAGSYEEVNAYATARVAEILGPTPKEAGMRFGRSKDGMRTVTVTDDQRRITDFEKTLDAVSEVRASNADPESQAVAKKRSQELLDSLWEHLDSGAGLVTPAYRTVIAIGLEDCVKVLRGEGDDVIIGLSDGTTMTGAEMLSALISEQLGSDIFAGLFHPAYGPVNLYETRFASAKQRILATAENLVCPWPDCSVPSDRGQVHHIHPHNLGGHTKPTNLAMLCKYHNGANDDNPNAPPRNGHIHRGSSRSARDSDADAATATTAQAGRVRYRSPGGRELHNTHVNSSLGAFDLI